MTPTDHGKARTFSSRFGRLCPHYDVLLAAIESPTAFVLQGISLPFYLTQLSDPSTCPTRRSALTDHIMWLSLHLQRGRTLRCVCGGGPYKLLIDGIRYPPSAPEKKNKKITPQLSLYSSDSFSLFQ